MTYPLEWTLKVTSYGKPSLNALFQQADLSCSTQQVLTKATRPSYCRNVIPSCSPVRL